MSAFTTVSEAAATANRENAQLSTGPSTPEGKQKSSQNSLIHGAYSHAVLLPGDDLAKYEALGIQLNDELLPGSDSEMSIYTEIYESTWRLNRIVSIERSTLFLKTELNLDAVKIRFADSVTDPAILRQFAQAEAYSTNARLFGQLHREEKRLRKLVDDKRKQIAEVAALRQNQEKATERQLASAHIQAAVEAARAQTQGTPPQLAATTDTPKWVRSVSKDRTSRQERKNQMAQLTAAKK